MQASSLYITGTIVPCSSKKSYLTIVTYNWTRFLDGVVLDRFGRIRNKGLSGIGDADDGRCWAAAAR